MVWDRLKAYGQLGEPLVLQGSRRGQGTLGNIAYITTALLYSLEVRDEITRCTVGPPTKKTGLPLGTLDMTKTALPITLLAVRLIVAVY